MACKKKKPPEQNQAAQLNLTLNYTPQPSQTPAKPRTGKWSKPFAQVTFYFPLDQLNIQGGQG